MDSQSLIALFDIIGAFVFSLSGALAAEKKQTDVIGMFVLALITAVGGGVVRDMLLGVFPVTFLSDTRYVIIVLLAMVLVLSIRSDMYRFGKLIKIFDAVGLGIFFSSGMAISLIHHLGFIPSILLGSISAIFGGIIRDVLSHEVPMLFRKELYVLTCFIGGIVYFILYLFPVPREYILILVAIVVSGLRLLAIQKNISLPR